MMPKRSFKKPEPTAAEVEIEQLKTQIAEQRGLVRDLTIVLKNRNAEIARLQIDVSRLKQENSELASDLRLHLGYAERDKARIERLIAERDALWAALKPFADIADLVNHTDTRDGECVYRLPRKPAGTGYFTLSREDFRRAKRTLDGGQSPSRSSVTTENIDKLQFGRSLHKRPVVGGVAAHESRKEAGSPVDLEGEVNESLRRRFGRSAGKPMMPKASHYAAAERIVTTQGLTFALAVAAGKDGDLRTAREMLKVAIANAIAAEFECGFSLPGDGQSVSTTQNE